MTIDKRPIGVFDSGVGGLTVVKELIKQLPNEDIIYFGDTARVPYGTKSRHTVIRFSTENTLFLLENNVKIVVVACNTASSVALSVIKGNFKVPVIGVIEPGARDAVVRTRNKRIGVIGTVTTVRSRSYVKRIKKFNTSIKVFSQSCPMLVPLAEEGWLSGDITDKIIRRYLLPIKNEGIDTLVLGCTHYPLLKGPIQKVVGKNIFLIDSAVSTAKAVKEIMIEKSLLNDKCSKGALKFFVSDEPEQFKRVGSRFLGKNLIYVKKASYGV